MSLVTVRTAAERLGVGYSTLKRWVHTGRVRTTRTEGGHHRISDAEIDRLTTRQQPDERRRARPADPDESLGGLSDSYAIRKEEVERIGGYDCQWIALVPKDQLRYGRRFCAEVGSGLHDRQ